MLCDTSSNNKNENMIRKCLHVHESSHIKWGLKVVELNTYVPWVVQSYNSSIVTQLKIMEMQILCSKLAFNSFHANVC